MCRTRRPKAEDAEEMCNNGNNLVKEWGNSYLQVIYTYWRLSVVSSTSSLNALHPQQRPAAFLKDNSGIFKPGPCFDICWCLND